MPWLREVPAALPEPRLLPAPIRSADCLVTMMPNSCESYDRVYLAPHPVADRAPYLDRRVLELAYALPHWLRLRRTPALVAKTLARNAFPEVPLALSKQGATANLNHAIAQGWKAIFDTPTLRGLVAALPRSFDDVLDRDQASAAIAGVSDAQRFISVHELAATAIWAEGMRRAGWVLS